MSSVVDELLNCGRLISAKGLVVGPGGNLSVREGPSDEPATASGEQPGGRATPGQSCNEVGPTMPGKILWVTPSGMAFEDLVPEDIVGVDIETGHVVSGRRRPTSEVLMHLFVIRKRPDVRAIVHTHPPSTIALVSSGATVKAMFPDFVVYLGAEVPNLDYITPTTRELAERTAELLGDGPGVTMTNHGALTVGINFKEALLRTEVLEAGARIQLDAMRAGKPRFLDQVEAEAILGLGSELYRQQLLRDMQG